MSNRFHLVAVASCSATLSVFVACASNPSTPPASPSALPDGGPAYAVGAAVDGTATTPWGDAGAPVGPVAPVGPATPAPMDAGSAPVIAVGEAAVDAVVDLAITTAAPKIAPKMEREGQPIRATLKEGEHFPVMITLMPNRCYSIVATSPLGSIEKLDLKLFGPPFYNVEAGKSGGADKNMPVIGKGSAALCPVLPLAVPYKLDVFAAKGAGRVGVHVFARNK
jgi:hypothetical protein